MEAVSLEINWESVMWLSLAAIAAMTFIAMIPVGKNRKLRITWFWRNLGVFVLVGVCIGGAHVPAFKADTPVMFGLVSALFAHLGRAAVPKAIRARIGSFLAAIFGGGKKG